MELENICKALKRERLDKHLSIKDTSLQTKLPPSVIRKIENCEDLENLGRIYLKGFLKIYAEFLNRKDLIESVETLSFDTSPQKPKKTRKQPPPIKEFLPLAKIPKLPRIQIRLNKKKLRILIVIVVIIIMGLFIKNRLEKSPAIKTDTTSPVPAAESQKPKPEPSTSKKQYSKPIVSILTRGKVFIRVKADGKLVFGNLLTKGAKESWKAREKLQIEISNPSLISLQIGSELIPTSNQRSSTTYTITGEGFSIQR